MVLKFDDLVKELVISVCYIYMTTNPVAVMNPLTCRNLQETRNATPSSPYYSLRKKRMGELKAEMRYG